MLTFGCTFPHEAQIVPHIQFPTPIAFQNWNCSSNCKSTAIRIAFAVFFSPGQFPRRILACAQSIADSVRWHDGALRRWCPSAVVVWDNGATLRCGLTAKASKPMLLCRNFHNIKLLSPIPACSQRCLVCTCFANRNR